MKKIIFIAALLTSIIFGSCNAPTTVNIGDFSTGEKVKTEFTFKDFFDPVTIVQADRDETSTAIIMDKNTGVLYIQKWSGYQWGMSPIMMQDNTVLTMEKFLAKHTEKKD